MKSKRYWLRFGIAFSIIGLIIAISFRMATLAGVNLDGAFNVYIGAIVAMGPGLILALFISSILGCQIFTDSSGAVQPSICSNATAETIIILSSVFIAYFVLGSIVGISYEAFKDKFSKTQV